MKANEAIKLTECNEELAECTDIICKAFLTVAKEYNITYENCPSYAAFRTVDQIKSLKEAGYLMFSLFEQNTRVGFVCIKEINNNDYSLGLLSILPDYRHNGYGKKLLDFIFNYIKSIQGEKVSIWLMNENIILKNWYINYGFVETGIRKAKGMPFIICDMEKYI